MAIESSGTTLCQVAFQSRIEPWRLASDLSRVAKNAHTVRADGGLSAS